MSVAVILMEPLLPWGFRKTYASRDDGKEVDGTGNLEWEGWIWRG
jgi:hypothetical protein